MSTPSVHLLIALLLVPYSVDAGTFIVDTMVDGPGLIACDDGVPEDCSLRGAILAANARPMSEASTIFIPAGRYVLTELSSCTHGVDPVNHNLSTTIQVPLCVVRNVTLQGAGAASTIIDGNQAHSVIFFSAEATGHLNDVTIANGLGDRSFGNPNGGGIVNWGALTLTDSVVRNSTLPLAAVVGGGIYNTGPRAVLTLLRSAVSDNVSFATGGGGGIYNGPEATLTVSGSTISNNSIVGSGGGINNSGGAVTITDSIVSGNSTSALGGGIANFGANFQGKLTMVNSTVSDNRSGSTGGGIFTGNLTTTDLKNVTITNNACVRSVNQGGCDGGGVGGPGISLQNTLIAANDSTGSAAARDCSGSLVSRGYNLIEVTTGCIMTGDLTGNLTGVDPELGVLADNGGFTRTHGLGESSPAVGAGNPALPGSGGAACAATDQRGVLRPVGATCDIGAFERTTTLSLAKILPTSGGNDGSVTAVLSGGGFVPATGVLLRRAGHADIPGSPVAAETAGAVLTTAFDLTDAAPGLWDVVVTNPDLASVILPGGFTVEEPRAADLFAIVVARSGARAGLAVRFSVLYGNRGNTDALGVPLTLGLPASFARDFSLEVAAPPALPGQPFDDYSDVPIEVTADVASEQAYIPLLIPIVPSGFTGLLAFTLTPPADASGEFTVEAFISTPWFANGTVRPDVVAEAAVRARQFATRGLGVAVGPEADQALIDYETAALDLAVTSSRLELLDNLGQNSRVFSVAYFAIDLAGYAAAQTMARAAPAPLSWFAAFPQWPASSFGLVASPAEAQSISPPCVCEGSGLISGGYYCRKNDPKCIELKRPRLPGEPPAKPPPDGLTPGECNDLGKHVVSADGRTCKPVPSKDCPQGVGSPFSTDPFCRTYPIRSSSDPNDKVGSGGSGPERFVQPDTPMPYAIAFENLPSATAAAQSVVVTDQLDTEVFDLDSFTLGPILVGDDIIITPPPGLTAFSGGADLRPAHNVVLRVDAALDERTGIVTWRFTSLDPATMQTLTDPDEGFLPPNTDPPAGDGQVHFTILPKAGLASGTEIRNDARIVFDTNAPIDTPEWLNTVDASAPSSQVDRIDPADCNASDLTVHWSGIDADSGVGTYSLFVSTDGGPFQLFVSDTPETSAAFAGEAGRSYGFYTVARDHAGNSERPPIAPDVVRCASSATPTHTPTRTPIPCAGDCDGSFAVTIDELIRGVNIVLDRARVQDCRASDVNGDGRVTVDELVAAVNRALRGCG